jgi:branched-chain amino acid transport system permease protein
MTRTETITAWTLGLVAALGFALVPVIATWTLDDATYWLRLYIWILFFAQCASAWNIIGGFAGQYSFGHSAFLGLGAYTSSLLWLNLGLTPWLGMFVGGVVAAGAAAIVAYPCFRLRGAFFALATIAFAEMLRVGLELSDTLFGVKIGGVSGLALPPKGDAPLIFQFDSKIGYAYVMLGILLVTLGIVQLIKRSRIGYYLAAIADDEEAVASLGTSPWRVKLAALLVSAFLTAIAGTFYAQFILFITPTRLISLDFSVQMVIMSVLGGLGTVLGPLYGAIILVPIAEITRAIWGGSLQGVHLIIYGALLIATILYLPTGIEIHVRTAFKALVRRIAGLIDPAGARGTTTGVPNRPVITLPEGEPLFTEADGWTRPPALTLAGVSRSFGGAVAVRDLGFTVEPGEVVGLIGPNGAGKTTVFNLITGIIPTQAGRITFGDQDLRGLSPNQINRLGIARTFQIVKPFTRLSALENVMVAALPRYATHRAARAEAERCLSFVGLAHRVDAPADGLSTGERKRLELARALATRPRLLLMDEVSGGLDQQSVPGLVALMRKVKEQGISVLVIEHNLRIIGAVADRLVMLNLGERIRDGEPEAVLNDPQVIDIYVGGAVAVG